MLARLRRAWAVAWATFWDEWEAEQHREGAPHSGCWCVDCNGARDARDAGCAILGPPDESRMIQFVIDDPDRPHA